MTNAVEILARELGAGTFDKTCSMDEQRVLRLYVFGIKQSSTPIDLGRANSWIETPEIVKRCLSKKHSPKLTGVGKCLTKVECLFCNYVYIIDSSD